MNNRKLVPLVTVAKDLGATDMAGIESLARLTGCLEMVAGIPHVFVGPFRKAYKAAVRAAGESRAASSTKPAKQVSDVTRLKMLLGKIPGRTKRLQAALQKAGIEHSTHMLAFKRAEAARRVTEISSMIRQQNELKDRLENELNKLTGKPAEEK